MKKVVLFGTMILALSTALVGCGQVKVSDDGNNIIVGKDKKSEAKSSKKAAEKRSRQEEKSRSVEKSISEKQSKEEAEKARLTWTEKKDAHLNDAMKSLGKKRKVTYVKYDGKHALKVSNVRIYPDTFKKDKFYLNGKKINIGWSPQGGDTYAYKVLSIYNRDLGKGNHATYLFCLHDKKPIVLVDTAKLAGRINLKISNDKSMNANFSDVMDGDL